jgi:chromosome segregation ATPase
MNRITELRGRISNLTLRNVQLKAQLETIEKVILSDVLDLSVSSEEKNVEIKRCDSAIRKLEIELNTLKEEIERLNQEIASYGEEHRKSSAKKNDKSGDGVTKNGEKSQVDDSEKTGVSNGTSSEVKNEDFMGEQDDAEDGAKKRKKKGRRKFKNKSHKGNPYASNAEKPEKNTESEAENDDS